MPRTIRLAVDLPAKPERLYDMYLNPKLRRSRHRTIGLDRATCRREIQGIRWRFEWTHSANRF
jgi:hypothetical protein